MKWLLNELRKASSGIDSKANPYLTMLEAISTVFKMKQGNSESNDTYVERFKNNVMTMNMVQGGHVFFSPGIVGKSLTDASTEVKLESKESCMAILLLINADPSRYSALMSSLKAGANLGRDEYPKTVAGMYELMVKHDQANNRTNRSGNYRGGRRGTTFAQARSTSTDDDAPKEAVAGTDGVLHSHVLCYRCQSHGHYAS